VPRRRFQQGCIRTVGQQWVLYFWRDERRNGIVQRVKVSKRLGPIKSLSRRAAQKAAQPILDSVNHQVEVPIRETRKAVTLAEFIIEWRKLGMIDFKESTRRSMESSIRAHLLPSLGELPVTTIDNLRVQELITSMEGRTRGTRENVVDDLLRILEDARKWHPGIPEVKKKDLKFGVRRPGEGRPFVFTPKQVDSILAEFAGGKTWDAFFTVLAGSGLRASEIPGLRVEDLDFEHGEIHVRQAAWHGQIQTVKTAESENSVPMTKTMKAKLQEHLVNHTHELVFVNRRGRPYSRNKVVQTILHPVLDKLNIARKGRRVGLHAFRHCLASMLLQVTGAAVAQRQLRHADASTTLAIYGHVLGDDHRNALEEISNRYFPSQSVPIGTS
jgi:integrase